MDNDRAWLRNQLSTGIIVSWVFGSFGGEKKERKKAENVLQQIVGTEKALKG